jgi:hypothetical protein
MATKKKVTAKAAAAPAKAVAKPQAAKAAKPAKAKSAAAPKARADKEPKASKVDKPRKPKLTRDSYTIPKDEYAVLEDLKQRAARLGRPSKKSEVLRAGIKALAGMTDTAFLASVGAVPAVKTGRPAKG